jgi:hypothetical protein
VITGALPLVVMFGTVTETVTPDIWVPLRPAAWMVRPVVVALEPPPLVIE